MKLAYKQTIFTDTSGLYNVVVTRYVPRQGGSELVSEAVAVDTPWPMACKCVAGILTGIGKPGIAEWDNGTLRDAELEPVDMARPFTAEVIASYKREMIRSQELTDEESKLKRENARLHQERRGTIGLTHSGVRC